VRFFKQWAVKRHIVEETGGDITAKQLQVLWEKQKGICVFTGRKMRVAGKTLHSDCASIDKINPKKGYTIKNVRFVTWQSNSARGHWGDNKMLQFCLDVVHHMGVK
jgi:hypothetical protein